MIKLYATDYIEFCKYLKDHWYPEFMSEKDLVDLYLRSDYPSIVFDNGRDFARGFSLSEADAIMFKLRWS